MSKPRPKLGDKVRISGHPEYPDGMTGDVIVRANEKSRLISVDMPWARTITGLPRIEIKYMTVIGKTRYHNPRKRSSSNKTSALAGVALIGVLIWVVSKT